MVRGIAPFSFVQSIGQPASRLALVVLFTVVLGVGVEGTTLAWAAPLPFWLAVTIGLLVRPVLADLRLRPPSNRWRDGARSFWAFCTARAFGSAAEVGLQWADVIIVGALTSAADAGVYAVATRAVRAGQVVDRAARIAASPTISAMLARDERPAATQLHTSAARTIVLLTWPYYLTLAIMGPAVMSIFGAGFERGAPVLALLATVMMVAAAAGMLQSILIQGGRPSWQMGNKGLALGLSIGLSLLLVPLWGTIGAAVAWVVVVLVDTLLASVQVHHSIGVRLSLRSLLPAMALPLVVFGVVGSLVRLTLGSTFAALLVMLIAAGSLYLVALWFLREPLGIGKLWQLLRNRITKESASHDRR